MQRGDFMKRTSAVVTALGLVLILALLIPVTNVLAATYYKTLTTFTRSSGYTTVQVSSASATMTETSSWISISKSSTYVFKISVSANTGDYRSATVKLVSGSNTTYYTVNQSAGRFLVTFNANNGTGGPGSQYKVYGSSITISGATPTRSGYSFLGWSASSSATSPTYYAGGTYAELSSSTLYAVWQRTTCLVTLHANGGTLSSYGTSTHSYYVYQYDTTVLSETASRTGFTFRGWSTSSTATSPSYTASPYTYVSISSGTTFYAVWQRNSYTLTFNALGGTCPESSRPVPYAYAFGALPTPTRSGYSFQGWYTDSSAGVKVTTATTMGAGSQTIYARWSRNVCTVTLNANLSGAVLNSYGTSTFSYNVYQYDTTVLSETARRTGFSFLGWSTSPTATSPSYTASLYTYVSISTNTPFYGVWQRNSYTLTFDAFGGTCSESSRPVPYAYAFGALPTPTRSGYSFQGWYTDSSAGAQVAATSTMGAGNQTIYARWSRNECTVTLNANKTGAVLDDFETGTYSWSVFQNDTITLTATASLSGYTFLGWSTSPTATTETYKPNANIQIPITGNTTFYAVWQKNNYTLTFNALDGTCPETTRTVAYQASFGTLPTPTKSGYSFEGWYTDSSAGVQVTSASTMGAGNQTIYARWKRETCLVTFYGSEYDRQQNTPLWYTYVNKNDMFTLTRTATHDGDGFEFLGWSTESGADYAMYDTRVNSIQIQITSDLDLFAVWGPISSYTLSYNANGGEGAPPSDVVPSGGYTRVSGRWPARQGYDFLGWATSDEDADSGVAEYFPGNSLQMNSNITLYAVWNTFRVEFVGMGGIVDTPSLAVLQNSYINFTQTATRAGYKFLGWSTDVNATNPTFGQNYVYTLQINSNMTFFAVWEQLPLNVTGWTDRDYLHWLLDCFVDPGERSSRTDEILDQMKDPFKGMYIEAIKRFVEKKGQCKIYEEFKYLGLWDPAANAIKVQHFDEEFRNAVFFHEAAHMADSMFMAGGVSELSHTLNLYDAVYADIEQTIRAKVEGIYADNLVDPIHSLLEHEDLELSSEEIEKIEIDTIISFAMEDEYVLFYYNYPDLSDFEKQVLAELKAELTTALAVRENQTASTTYKMVLKPFLYGEDSSSPDSIRTEFFALAVTGSSAGSVIDSNYVRVYFPTASNIIEQYAWQNFYTNGVLN